MNYNYKYNESSELEIAEIFNLLEEFYAQKGGANE